MTVWVVPLESVEGRYSEQWNVWFPAMWDEARFLWGDPALQRQTVKDGDFLDPVGTTAYKASQLGLIAEAIGTGAIQDGDVLWFHDLWFPLTQVFYMLDLLGLDVKVGGFLHAGAYCPQDALNLGEIPAWAAPIEEAWFRRVDSIVVFSEYHKGILVAARDVDPMKVEVVCFPYMLTDLSEYRNPVKDIPVVFPGRPGPDKGWDAVSVMEEMVGPVVRTWDRAKTKEGYYRLLARAQYVFMWPPSETFGIAVMEAVYLGAVPLVPRKFAYGEYYAGYRTIRQAADQVLRFPVAPFPPSSPAMREAPRAFDRIWQLIEEVGSE